MKAVLTSLLIVLLAIFFGVTYDVDYCRYTAERRAESKIWGIPIPYTSKQSDGFRSWLENDLNIQFPQEYLDYIEAHPLLFAKSTPRGNWLWLRTLKRIYDHHPDSHDDIRKLISLVRSRDPPLFTHHDADEQNRLVERYLTPEP